MTRGIINRVITRKVDLEMLKKKAKHLEERNPEIMMMSAIDCIVQLAEDSGFENEFFDVANKYITYLSDRQGISKIQAVLFSLFVELSASGTKTSLSDLADHIGCSNIKVIKYQKEIEGLVNMGLIRRYKKDEKDDNLYCIPNDIFSSLAEDEPYHHESYSGLTGIQFFQKYYEITKLRHEGELSTALLIDEVERLIEANKQLEYVKNLKTFKLNKKEELLVTHFCMYPILTDKRVVSIDWLRFLFDTQSEEFVVVYALQNGSHTIVKKGLIEPVFNDGFSSNEEYALTDSAQKKLLKGFAIKQTEIDSCHQLNHRDIISKDLFFDTKITEQLGRLEALVDDKEYKRICNRLQKSGMRQSFACLFYGAPGTGKTESALQLAKRSGRDIFQVNISEIKSKWVGESEKNIKAIFDRYRSMIRHSKRVPILLFNEADAVLGIRKKGADHAIDKMENSIQNIILQEMETMKGIMIATTNLEQNLDKAFERRFLYKVKFDKPSSLQRQSIWKSFLPSLSDEEIEQIASSYDFCGGQIENIARKCCIDSVLYGEESICIDRIKQYCNEETLSRQIVTKIGYR